MPVLRSTVLLDAPPRTVAGLLRDADLAATTLARDGHRLTAPVRLLSPGDEVQVAARVLPGVRISLRIALSAVSTAGTTSVLRSGPLRGLTHTATLTATPAGTVLVDELRWTAPLGLLGRVADAVALRRIGCRLLAARSAMLVDGVKALGAGLVVVATALVRDGRVLAARRTRPPELAGRWELPGGRVEAGESEPEAVVRECREELGAVVRVLGRLGTDLPLPAGVLRVHTAQLVAGSPEPRALEHSGLRWVGPDDLADLDWVDADRAVVADLVETLTDGVAAGG